MMIDRTRPSLALALLLLAGCAVAAAESPGEQTQPLATSAAAPYIFRSAASAPVFERAIPLPQSTPIAAANGMAYFYDAAAKSLSALDLQRGRFLWRKQIETFPDSFAATQYGVTFAQNGAHLALVALDARTGNLVFRKPGYLPAGAVGATLFAKDDASGAYVAASARTGSVEWETYGGGMRPAGTPVRRNGTILQLFADSGAILENNLYAFDAQDGHALWRSRSNAAPLGYADGIVYVDATWFPQQMDHYIPLTVSAITLGSGKPRDAFTYRPDPERNAAIYRNASPAAYVRGGFVYLKVGGQWYRYDADRQPLQAHASRIDGYEVLQAFDDGKSLLSSRDGLYIGQSSGNALRVQSVVSAPLQSPVAATDSDGAYAVAGKRLFRIDTAGTPHQIGRADCTAIVAVVPWPNNVAVLCNDRILRFADKTPTGSTVTIRPRAAAGHHLGVHAFAIPPHSGFMHQWWVGPVVPWRDGGVVMTLDAGAMNLAGAIAFVSKNGVIRTITLGKDLPPPPPGSRVATTTPRSEWPPKPRAIAYERNGDVWFNNVAWPPALYRLAASGEIMQRDVSTATQDSWRHAPVRVTLGPDGYAWIAHSLPSKAIERTDGSRTIPIPDRYGDALILRAASDGFWFLSATQLVHVTLSGTFSATALPPAFQNVRTYPGLVATSNGGEIWIAAGTSVALMNASGVKARYSLPDATLGVNAMTTTCNGSLLVAENAPALLRLRKGAAKFEQYDLEYRQIDGLTRTPDCAIWFAEGSNMPEQRVGTLSPSIP